MLQTNNQFTMIRNRLVTIVNRLEKIKKANEGTRVAKEINQVIVTLLEEINKLP